MVLIDCIHTVYTDWLVQNILVEDSDFLNGSLTPRSQLVLKIVLGIAVKHYTSSPLSSLTQARFVVPTC